jgi:hypothetical protein
MKVVVNAELIKGLNKKKDTAQLNYFKKELIKVLEKNDEEIVSKAIEDYDESIRKAFNLIGIEKAGYGIGTVRVWKGQKFRKIAPGKWRRIYDSNTRGARQSINIIKKKIANAQSIDELLDLVMENTNRFMDSEGKLLPIVEELKKAVNESKGRLNAGKPTTQEQIDKFKADNNTNTLENLLKEADTAQFERTAYYKNTFNSPEEKQKYVNEVLNRLTPIKKKLNDFQFEYQNGKSDLSGEQYDIITDKVLSVNSAINFFGNILDKIKQEIQENEEKKKVDSVNVDNLKQSDWQEIQKFNDEVNNFIESKLNEKYFWGFKKEVTDLLNNMPVSFENKMRWYKLNGCKNFQDFYKYVEDKLNAKLREKAEAEKFAKNKALKEKIENINKDIKTYSDEEIKKSFDELAGVQKEIDSLRDKVKDYNTEVRENKKAYAERANALKMQGIGRWDRAFTEDPEIKKTETKDNDLWHEGKEIKAQAAELEKKLDPLLDAIGYYYLNKFEYEKDSSVDDCKTTDEVAALITSKDWYNEKGNEKLNLNNVDTNAAKEIFKCMERIFAIFPEQKGAEVSFNTKYSNSNMWACASVTNGVTLNSKYYKNYNDLQKGYEESIGFHPVGTEANSIVFHEYYHVMTTMGDLAKKIKERVTKKLKMKGKKGGPKQSEVIAKGISEYATKNADEFGAECFCQALGSESPTQFAIEVFKETLKFKKYMRGLV